MTLGLGRAAVVKIPTNDEYEMDVGRARERRSPTDRAAGRRPIADRRDGRHDVVDLGRPGGGDRGRRRARGPVAPRRRAPTPASVAIAARAARRRSRGWERADSIVVNPHKWLFTPLDASLLLTPAHGRAPGGVQPRARSTCGRSTATAPVLDYNEYQPQLGRRFRALKLWMQLRWFGLEGLRRRIAAPPRAGRGVRGAGSTPTRTGSAWRPCRSRRSASATGRAGSLAARTSRARAWLDATNAAAHGRGQPDRRGVPVAHPAPRPVHDPPRRRQPAHGGAPRRARLGAAAREAARLTHRMEERPMSRAGRGPLLLPDPLGRPRRVRGAVPQEPLADPAGAAGDAGRYIDVELWTPRFHGDGPGRLGRARLDHVPRLGGDRGAHRRGDRRAGCTRTRRRSRREEQRRFELLEAHWDVVLEPRRCRVDDAPTVGDTGLPPQPSDTEARAPVPPITELTRIEPVHLARLEKQGVFTTGILLEVSETPTRRQTLADHVDGDARTTSSPGATRR